MQYTDGSIMKAPNGGGSATTIASQLNGPEALAIDDKYVYWVELRCTVNKCTRPCCSSAEGYFCGPAGRCDLTINFGQGAATLNVCTFPIPCTPWAHDCPAAGPETDCHFNYGEFSCTFPNYSVDGGSTEGQTCTYINDCGDSQVCFYSSGATSGTCRWLCKAAAAGAPDAGTLGGAPGSGGCPTGQTCKAWGQPTWLGYCSP